MGDNFKATRFMLPTSSYDEDKAEYVVNFIENLKHTKGEWHNKPFILLPWQKEIIRNLFGVVKEDGYRQFTTGYVEIPEYNETLRYRKWEGNQWSNETYEPTVDTVVQDSLHNLELLIESQEEVVQNQQKEIARLTNINATLNQKIESLEQDVLNSMLALAENYETLMLLMEEPI